MSPKENNCNYLILDGIGVELTQDNSEQPIQINTGGIFIVKKKSPMKLHLLVLTATTLFFTSCSNFEPEKLDTSKVVVDDKKGAFGLIMTYSENKDDVDNLIKMYEDWVAKNKNPE